VRATTLLNKLPDLPGIAVSGVSFPAMDPSVMIVDVRLRGRWLACPHCDHRTRARYDSRRAPAPPPGRPPLRVMHETTAAARSVRSCHAAAAASYDGASTTVKDARMKRKILAAITVGILASLALAAPAVAVSFETDYATGSAPSDLSDADGCMNILRAPQVSSGVVCFWSDGDIFSVEDQYADGHSMALRWWNYYNGALYRQGVCVETGGLGGSGICNKNFHENSQVVIQACTWESVPNTKVDCSNILNLYA
jgi:hypothetical protein